MFVSFVNTKNAIFFIFFSPPQSNEDSDNVELDLPQNVETCLQMNLVYQEVLQEKLDELEKLLRENREQQVKTSIHADLLRCNATGCNCKFLKEIKN